MIKSHKEIYTNLELLSVQASKLILWLDYDREGEAIAFDVLEAIQASNPSIDYYRAKFSAVTPNDVTTAMKNLVKPDRNLADAVEVRQEIDLRIGASFTRFQTISFSHLLNNTRQILSYGPCQFPTLGFIVQRWKEIKDFNPEAFWSLKLAKTFTVNKKKMNVRFNWKKERVYNEEECEEIYNRLTKAGKGKITAIDEIERFKKRPQFLNTIGMQKALSRHLNLSSEASMDIAEKLYNKGLLSYPRTETTIFTKNTNLRDLVAQQMLYNKNADYAKRVFDGELWGGPNNGTSDDKAHPPIHPVKAPDTSEDKLTKLERIVYDYISQHFLACISKDAVYYETKITLSIEDEDFIARGVRISEPNFLEIYNPENFQDTVLPDLEINKEMSISSLKMEESSTKPPNLLSESSLISLMDKHGIGTDATIHEHIKKIQDRGYTQKVYNTFRPTPIGIIKINYSQTPYKYCFSLTHPYRLPLAGSIQKHPVPKG